MPDYESIVSFTQKKNKYGIDTDYDVNIYLDTNTHKNTCTGSIAIIPGSFHVIDI